MEAVDWVKALNIFVLRQVEAHSLEGELENCHPLFYYQCPKNWHALEATNSETVRFCSACLKPVYWCETPEQAKDYAKEGDCMSLYCFGKSKPALSKVNFRNTRTLTPCATETQVEFIFSTSRKFYIQLALTRLKDLRHFTCFLEIDFRLALGGF